MTHLIRLLIFTFIFHSTAFANEKEALEKRQIETLALTFQDFANGKGEFIWPDFHLTERPVLFHFQNGHVYAFGLAGNSPLWERFSIHHYPILFCAQSPVPLIPLHPAFPVDGQHVFVFGLDHQDDHSSLPLLTFIHERFHIHQFQTFDRERVIDPIAIDYQSPDLLAWMEVEQRLLALFLQTKSYEMKEEYLKDYLAVNDMRRQLIHPESIQWEDHQQKMEGLADYVSIKTFQVFSHISNFNAEEFLLEMRKKKNPGLVFSPQDAMKGRHYFVGAALGWALDFCGRDHWKIDIQRTHTSLHAMLENQFPMESKERFERLMNAQKLLNWFTIREEIDQLLKKAKEENEKILQTFSSQEGIIIKMGTPSGSMSSGGRHQKSYQMGCKKALINDTSVATSQDQSWTLRFENIPLVFEEQNGDRFFKLHPEVKLEIDGKPFPLKDILQDKREFSFYSLALKHEYCELASKRSGKLCIEDGLISVKFH